MFGRFTIGFLTTSADYNGHFKGALKDSVLVLDLAGDSPDYCPTGGLASLPQHPDGTFGVMSLSPHTATFYCDYLFRGGSLLFVPNPGPPWF